MCVCCECVCEDMIKAQTEICNSSLKIKNSNEGNITTVITIKIHNFVKEDM